MTINIIDPNVSLPTNILLIIGNVLNVIQNIPQVVKTYKTKSTKDFSSIFIILRIISNLIWTVYAIEIASNLLIFNNVVTILATGFIGYYKFIEYSKNKNRLNNPYQAIENGDGNWNGNVNEDLTENDTTHVNVNINIYDVNSITSTDEIIDLNKISDETETETETNNKLYNEAYYLHANESDIPLLIITSEK